VEIFGGGSFQYDLPDFDFWAPNTTYDIPFSTFTDVNFSAVTFFIFGFEPPATIAGNTAYSASASFTSISAVPEPSTLAMLAAGGVIRRRRLAAKA